MSNKPKFGIIGAGGIAESYAQAFEHCKDVTVAAVADVRPDAAKALAERLSCQSFNSYETMIKRVRLDAVVICTPPVTHAEVSLHMIDNGVHVICEKPLTTDLKN